MHRAWGFVSVFQGLYHFAVQSFVSLRNGTCGTDFLCRHCRSAYYKTVFKNDKAGGYDSCNLLCGAVFCMFCDLIARTIFSPSELAIGTVTAVFGAPVVIWLMVKRQK